MIVFTKARNCSMCQIPGGQLQELHAMIWDVPADAKLISPAMRRNGYGTLVMQALAAMESDIRDVKSVYRHAQHVEKTGRIAPKVQGHGTRQVLRSDYQSITDMAASLGALSMEHLQTRIEEGQIEARDLVATAKMGVIASAEREKMDRKDQRQHNLLDAMMQLAGGFITQESLPEGEVIEGEWNEEVLEAEIHAERETLLIAARTA